MILPTRPEKMIVVAGTGTGVGKTWIAKQLLEAWKSFGCRVAARKPAQSYAEGTWPTDADVLAGATDEAPEQVCLKNYWYPVDMAPPMAADALDMDPPTVNNLAFSVAWQPGVDIGLVELSGGVRSPQAVDGDGVDLANLLKPHAVVLVTEAELGCINLVRMSLNGLKNVQGPDGNPVPVITVLNRFTTDNDIQRRILEWLRDQDGIQVVTGLLDGLVPAARELAGDLIPPD